MTQKISQKVSDLYPELYHYTNQKGLKGILESQSLWAIHYKNLNDGTELKRFVDTIKKPLSEKFEEACKKEFGLWNRKEKKRWEKCNNLNLQREVEEEAQYLIGVMQKAIGEGFFISSFCYHNRESYEWENGLLSQWRSYGKDGYAIVFDTKKLEEMMRLESEKFPENRTLIMANVIYENCTTDDREDFDYDSEKVMMHSLEFLIARTRGQINPDKSSIGETYEPFVKCVSRLKHPAFQEEKEIRIVCHSAKENGKNSGREIKSGCRENGTEFSYQEIFGFSDKKLPIKRIIIGPAKNQNELEKDLIQILKIKNLEIEITRSETPLIQH